jgi:hypothetical protein
MSSFEHGNEPSGFIKREGISSQAERPLASQEEQSCKVKVN